MAATANATALRNSSWSWTLRYRPRADRDRERDARDDEDLVGQGIQLLRQRGLLDGGRLEHATDVTDLGGHAGRDHQDGAGAAGDLAVHERHVHPVAQGGVRGDRLDLLGRGDALAGERGLVDLEGRGGQDPRVGRDEVTGLDVDDVARDELVHRDLGEVAVASDLGLDDHHLLEGRGAGLRLAFLVHGHPGVEERQQDEEHAGVELAGQEQADDARDEQHDLHRVRVLAAERLPAATPSWPHRTCSCRRWRAGRPPRPRSGRPRGRP